MANARFGVNILPKNNTETLGNSDHPWTIVSPALTGTPTAPTAADGTKTSQIATTEFVQNAKEGMLDDIVAPEYDSTATYEVGEYCTHDGDLYKCNTAIDVAEDWTAAHWDKISITEELGKLTGYTNIISGTIANFPDGADGLPMTVTAEINPVQDLHGYDNPWPGGGGKNKLPLPVATSHDGITLTHNGDGSFTLTGTASSTTYFDFFAGTFDSTAYAGYKFIVYAPSGAVASAALRFRISSDSRTSIQEIIAAETETTIIDNGSGLYFAVRVPKDFVIPTGGYTIKAMLYASTESSVFAPYENLCPISGWTGASVTVSPTLNEQDGTTYSIAFPSSAGTVYGGTLTVNKDGSGKLIIDTVSDTVAIDNTWTDGGSSKFYKTNALSNRCAEGSSAYAISNLYLFSGLGNTNTSDMTTDKRFYMKGYNKRILIRDDRYSTLSDFVTAMSGQSIQVVYRLYTPVEIDLTAEQINSLKGVNNVWADCGDIKVEYMTDSGIASYIKMKADKVSGATNGNFAGLDSNGNLTDSGKKASDFALADEAVTSVDYDTTNKKITKTVNGHVSDIVSVNTIKTDLGKFTWGQLAGKSDPT